MQNDKKRVAMDLGDWAIENADVRKLSFNDVVAASGIDQRQLRNAMDRGVIRVGALNHTGRWEFGLRDCVQLKCVAILTQEIGISLGNAAEVSQIVGANFARLIKAIPLGLGGCFVYVIVRFNAGEAEVAIWERTESGSTFEPIVGTFEGFDVGMSPAIQLFAPKLINETWTSVMIALKDRVKDAD